MEKQIKSTSEFMNYEQHGSNSINYNPSWTSSSPESFPVLMENGIIVNYEAINFSSKIVVEEKALEEK